MSGQWRATWVVDGRTEERSGDLRWEHVGILVLAAAAWTALGGAAILGLIAVLS